MRIGPYVLTIMRRNKIQHKCHGISSMLATDVPTLRFLAKAHNEKLLLRDRESHTNLSTLVMVSRAVDPIPWTFY